MVRTPAHALPRPHGFALLGPATRPQLDAARILTLSGTIAVNLFALGMLMLPLSMPPPATTPEDVSSRPVLREIPPDPPVVEIVPIRTPQPPAPVAVPVQPRSVAPSHADTVSTATVSDLGTERAVDDARDTAGPVEAIEAIPAAPSPVQLEYRLAPAPKYPRGALLRRVEGTVLLQVLVGVDGRALDVSVATSSGNRELDEAARMQVLKRWVFNPAMKDGRAVQAMGLVPIEFSLQR